MLEHNLRLSRRLDIPPPTDEYHVSRNKEKAMRSERSRTGAPGVISYPSKLGALVVLLLNLGDSSGAAAAGLRISSGGAAVGGFLADCHVSGGLTGHTSAAIDVSHVHSPAPQAVYQSERWGDFTYAIPGLTPGAYYTVRMHFAELFWDRAGVRVFHVTINGASALSNFDIFAAAGAANVAVVKEFTTKPDAQGTIKIAYKGIVGHAKSSGIEILMSPAPSDAPTVRLLDKPPVAWSPDGSRYLVCKEDRNDIFQLYVGRRGDKGPACVTGRQVPGDPRPDRHKQMASWHPSGKWIILGVERAEHENLWWPSFLRKGIVECGIWLDIYATTPDGTRWYKLADTAGGFTGVPFTTDGKRGAWAKIVDGNIIAHPAFGLWKLEVGEFVEEHGVPSFKNVKDISPPGAVWLEPGNFSPDGQSLMITSDIGIKDNQGMDQYILNVKTGKLTNLTNSPKIWDEHGVFSPDGKQVLFMSSYPYRNDPKASRTLGLKTEFMLINVDGSGLRQLTHFNVPGYAESFPHGKGAVAACGVWSPDRSRILASSLRFPDYDWWEISWPNCSGK
jgi:hypothetical protein